MNFGAFKFSDLLPSSFTAKNGLVVLCKHIEEHPSVGHEVKKFDIRIHMKEKRMSFTVYWPYVYDSTDKRYQKPDRYKESGSCNYPFTEGEWFINLIQSLVAKEVKTADKADYVILHYDETAKEIPVEVFMTMADGTKTKLNHVIK